jgi:hypothetical protein
MSIGLAVLVARLEDTLLPPKGEAFFPATLGEFVKVYENGERCCGIAAGLRRQH